MLAVLLATFAGTYLARKITYPWKSWLMQRQQSPRRPQQHVAIESKIAELNSLKQTFNDMTESLRQSDEAKKAFIADVTHELRTPLTVIKGTIETLEDGVG